jgi:hypothetical protein
MKVFEAIPLTPQSWNRNPNGYVQHQLKLRELTEWLESQDVPVSLPIDTGGWDKGVDLIVDGSRWDLKGFQLESYSKSLTWSSTYHQGRPAPIYNGTETDYFVHPTDGDPSTWIVAPIFALHTSKYGYQPYYDKAACMTVGELVQDVFTS